MVKKILGVVILLLVLLLGYAATLPDQFSVQRSAVIQAPAEKIYPYLVDFQKFGQWSPWEKIDPELRRNFSGPATGVGSVYEWSGNRDVGAGRMEITETVPNARVAIQLEFFRPFQARNTSEYTLQPVPEGTALTLTMSGPSPYVSKLMSVFFNMDTMIGRDFERGLANLKALAEKAG